MADANTAEMPATPGWDAIDAALARVYGDVEPHHYGTVLKFALGGPDPLDGVSVYASDAGRPHWHYVSYGFSELYEKESPDPNVSGFGFELTFRLTRGAEETPPVWPISFMQNLARYVFQSGNAFAAGHSMNANGPVATEEDTRLTAVAFRADPELPALDTPHGRLAFLQLVAVTADELAAIQAWNCADFLRLLSERDALLVTDLARGSVLDDAAVARRVDAGIDRDGSAMGGLFLDSLEATATKGFFRKRVAVTLGALSVESFRNALRGRILHGRPVELVSPKTHLRLTPGAADDFTPSPEGVTLTVSEKTARALVATLRPKRGTYTVPTWSQLAIEVVPTVVRDARTNAALETIG